MVIYRITNRSNGLIYIGKCASNSLAAVWRRHYEKAKKQKANGYPRSPEYTTIEDAINDYGVGAFTIDVVQGDIQSRDELKLLEAHHIALAGSQNPQVGYNITKGGDDHWKNYPMVKRRLAAAIATPAARAKNSASKMGNKFGLGKACSFEKRAKIRASLTGVKHPPDRVAKNRAAQIGKTLTPEHRANIGAGVKKFRATLLRGVAQ